jgi:dTMP kinase
MKEPKKGLFIAIEGVDGAGSSTQTKLLVSSLAKLGHSAVATKEPNPDGRVEGLIRSLLNSSSENPALDALLFAADRIDHVERCIKPWLASNKIVVSDRYLESSLAYQTSQGLPEHWVISINRFAVKPDLTIILDIDPSISLERKPPKRERFENKDFLSKVRMVFLKRAVRRGYMIADASKPVDEVHRQVLSTVIPLLDKFSVGNPG